MKMIPGGREWQGRKKKVENRKYAALRARTKKLAPRNRVRRT
jgi:hypothetical protein